MRTNRLKGSFHDKLMEENTRAVAMDALTKLKTIANMTDIDLEAEDPTKEISLKERINDLEIAVCDLMDMLAEI